MMRWYDYPIAFLAADFMTGFLFSGSIFGGALAYMIYIAWCNYYCTYRLKQEETQ